MNPIICNAIHCPNRIRRAPLSRRAALLIVTASALALWTAILALTAWLP